MCHIERLGVDSAQGDSAHLNSAQTTKVFLHRMSRQNRATRDFGLAGLSRCALQQILGPWGPSESRCDSTITLCSIF